MCLFKRTIKTDGSKDQLKRLRTGSSLVIEDCIILRNVFLYCLEGHSPNRYRKGDIREVAKVLSVASERQSRPYVLYGNYDGLNLILTGIILEPRNFLYSYCRIRPCPWVVVASL